MFLSDVSIKRPVFATMLNILIIIFGIIAFQKIGVDNQPKVDLPIVNIRVQVPGATPKYIEQNVVNSIESAIKSIEGVDTIQSSSTTGSVSVRVMFLLTEDINVAVNNVRNAMTGVTGSKTWPTNALAPIVKAVDPNAAAILQIAVSSESNQFTETDLAKYMNDIFEPNLFQAEGIGDVGVAGLRLPEFDILFDSQRLNSLGVSALTVANQISNQITSIPGGKVQNGRSQINIDTSTTPQSLQELAHLSISLPSKQVVKLSELAQIISTLQQQTTYGESDYKPALIAYISKASSANTVQAAANARATINRLEKAANGQISMRIVNDTSKFISESMSAVEKDILIGSVLTILIVLLFLHDLRATLISAIAIPTSVIGSIAVMYLFGFTLNSMTTLALSLSIGIIVDDAIVVIENIHRHLELGKAPFAATHEAMKEIGIPAVAITFAIVAVFLPVAFMEGIVGRFFYEFAITVSISVLISLFVAFTLTPMLGSRFLSLHEKTYRKNILFEKIDLILNMTERFYIYAIKFTLRYRLLTVVISFAILGISILLLRFVPTTFQPQIDTAYFSLDMQLNPNTDLPETVKRSQEIETWLKSFPGVSNVFFRLKDNSDASFMINLVDPNQRRYTQKEIQARVRKEIKKFARAPDEIFSIGKPGFSQQDIQIVFTHPNLDLLKKYAQNVQDFLKSQAGVVDISTDTSPQATQIKVTPNYALANSMGVSSSDIANTISNLFYGITVGTYNDQGDSFNIVARMLDGQSKNPDDLLNINIPARNNTVVPLTSVASVSLETQNSEIRHYNGMREYTILANYTGKDLGGVMKNVDNYIKETSIPGLSYNYNGDLKNLKDSNRAVIKALILSFIFAYMVLCAQFESYVTPFVIILSVPLAFSGAFIGLLVTDQPLSLYAMVGLILLTGLVKKNGILLLDFTEQKMREGFDIAKALEISGGTRLRPILMTTFAMIFGMLPMAFGSAIGHEQRTPMGFAVIGGLISSTILTLLVIPCAFSLFEDLKAFVKKKLGFKNNAILGSTEIKKLA